MVSMILEISSQCYLTVWLVIKNSIQLWQAVLLGEYVSVCIPYINVYVLQEKIQYLEKLKTFTFLCDNLHVMFQIYDINDNFYIIMLNGHKIKCCFF